jgi:cell division septation protein DedD
MARDWLRLVLATAVAFAMAGSLCALTPATAQTTEPAKKTAKPAKKTAKKADAEPETDEQGQPKKKKQDPAEAAKAIDAAFKLIESGKAEAAATSLTATLSAGNLPSGMMARALYYRGTANRQLQKPALAIQDLTQALWIKGGLTDSDRAEALRQRSAAYADAGVGDSGVYASSGASNRVASNEAVTTGSNSSAQSGSPGGGWNIFGNLFGQSSASSAPPSPPPAPAPKVAAAAAPTPAPVVSGWSSQTEVRPQAVATASQPVASAPMPPPAAAVPDGRFRIQLGLVRSEGEANGLASRVSGELAGVFETRRASIDQTVVGNMGTMYRVRVGPYASAQEGQAVCGRLKGTGLDCLVVTQ